jgi:hypothetical protein
MTRGKDDIDNLCVSEYIFFKPLLLRIGLAKAPFEHRKLTGILKEMIPEERNRGFAFGTKERFLPFQRKDRSVQAKRRKQKIQSDSRERRNARIQLLCRSRSSLSYPCFLPPAMAPPSSISFLPDELPVHAVGRTPAVESPSQNCQSASGLLPAQCRALPLSCCLALSYWLRCLASFCLIQESRWTGS